MAQTRTINPLGDCGRCGAPVLALPHQCEGNAPTGEGPAIELRDPRAPSRNPGMSVNRFRPCSRCGTYCYGDCAS